MPQKNRRTPRREPQTPPPARALPRVAVCLAPYPDYQLGILQGVRAYLAKHPEAFELLTHRGNPYLRFSDLESLRPDGVIANIHEDNVAIFQPMRVPVVKIGARGPDIKFPTVEMNGEQAGRVAAGHLLSLGLKNLGVVGVADAGWSQSRANGFCAGVKSCGLAASVHELTRSDELQVADSAGLATWLLDLSRPAGIFVVTDLLARRILEIARSVSLAIPRDLAVVGFNNGLYECLFTEPHLSSVPQDHHGLGSEAARLMVELLEAGPRPAAATHKCVALCAAPVVRRRSTAVIAWHDPVLRECVEFFHRQLDEAAGLREVFDAYPEERLRLARRLDPGNPDIADKSESARLRLALAEQLLRETTMPIVSITECCGLWEESRLRLAFKDACGCAPAEYRARFSHPLTPHHGPTTTS